MPTQESKRNGPGALFALSLMGAVLVFPTVAFGKPTTRTSVVVLDFTGKHANRGRRVVVRSLRKQYRVLPGSELLAAFKKMNVPFAPGPNLARASSSVGAVAVVSGKVDSGKLRVMVYDGATGKVVAQEAVPWKRRPPAASVQKVRSVVLEAINGLRGEAGEEITFKPDAVARSMEDTEEPPLEPTSGAAPKTSTPAPSRPAPAVTVVQPAATFTRSRIEGRVGLGIWSRSLSLDGASAARAQAEYSSGAAFALEAALRGYPLAFFRDDFTADFWARVRFKTAIGLSSDAAGAASGSSLNTTMWQLLADVGYRWNVLRSDSSPLLDFGVGFGLLNFGIDWEGQSKQVADLGYRFLLLGLGVEYPFMRSGWAQRISSNRFLRNLSIEAGFQYRVVFSAGEIENQSDPGYGPASSGGVDVTVGFGWMYKRITARLAYAYTLHFNSFDAQTFDQRVQDGLLAAASANDQFHGVFLSGGYAF